MLADVESGRTEKQKQSAAVAAKNRDFTIFSF